MQALVQDLRYGARKLLRRPGVNLLIILILALGVGASSTLFSLVNAALFRPLPYPDGDALFMIWQGSAQKDDRQRPVSPQVFAELLSQNQGFEQIAAFVWNGDVGFSVTGGGEPERVQGAIVSGNFFQTLGVAAARGRTFTAEDDNPAGDLTVVLSHRLWARRYASDPNLLGQKLTLNERVYTVIGVMPERFEFPAGVELWAPRPLHAGEALNTALPITFGLRVLARARPDLPPAQVQESLSVIGQRLRQADEGTYRGVELKAVPLRDQLYGSARPAFLLLFSATGFLLLIACANAANLLLARAAARQHEITVRVALGATRLRIIQQLFTENTLLAVLGGALGLLLCAALLDVLTTLLSATPAFTTRVTVDHRVLGFTLAVTVLTGLLFGLAPALHASRPNLNDALKEGVTRSAAGAGRQRLLDVIVGAEIALALLLSIGAVLVTHSFVGITRTPLGFEPERALSMKLTLAKSRYPDGARQTAFYQRVLQRLSALPGVQYAGASNFLPLEAGGFQTLFLAEGQAPPVPGQEPRANCAAVSPDYFKALGISLIRGRTFTEQDSQQSPKVVIVGQTMARRLWPAEEPIGKHVNFQGQWYEVVGLVSDVRQGFGSDSQPGAQMYVPYGQFDFPWPYAHVVIRTTVAQPAQLAAAARAAIWAEDKNQPVENVRLLEQVVADRLAGRRFMALLLVVFALTAVGLAAVGIYGVTAYYVSHLTHEIGIRMALGAQARDILRLVLVRGLVIMLLGIGVGLALAVSTTRLMSSLLYGVSTTDPLVYFQTTALFAAVTVAALLVPARKATKVDPLIALRWE